MGIGALDPDAVMVVQTIDGDRQKSVLYSYLRDPQNPPPIVRAEGEFDSFSELGPETEIDEFFLD